MKGTYLLVMRLQSGTSITVGKQGRFHFQKGCYVYIGSAFKGLEQRIQRHLRNRKKIHWHIDYFLPFVEITGVFYKENTRKEECTIAQVFSTRFKNLPGFGCSDCACISHLFIGSYHDVVRTIDSLHMKPYPGHTNP